MPEVDPPPTAELLEMPARPRTVLRIITVEVEGSAPAVGATLAALLETALRGERPGIHGCSTPVAPEADGD